MSSKPLRLAALLGSIVCLPATADALRVEGGLGVFQPDPGGGFEEQDGDGRYDFKDHGIDTQSDLYAWMLFKHPVPLVPNVRLEYLSLSHAPDAGEDFDTREIDGILYYNLLDDTLALTLDLGVDVKQVKVSGNGFDATRTIGLLFGRARVEPTDWLGFEALVQATEYGDNTGYDLRVKADYTMTFVPVLQPALELGYRVHKLQYDLGDQLDKGEYSGFYGGVVVRF